MIIDLSLILVMGVMYGVGVYLILDRTMTRVLLGLMLLTNATNLLILHAGGPAGLAPLFDKSVDPHDYSDPLPQALVLTSIVISFAVTSIMLGLIYRAWILSHRDEIMDDSEDRLVAQKSSFDPEEDTPANADESEFDGDEATREREYQIYEEKKHAQQPKNGGNDGEENVEPAGTSTSTASEHNKNAEVR